MPVMFIKWLVLAISMMWCHTSIAQQNTAVVFGKVTTINQKPVELANVKLLNLTSGTVTDSQGNYELRLPVGTRVTLQFSYLGYASELASVTLIANEKKRIDIVLREENTLITGPIIEDRQTRTSSLTRIDPRIATAIPSISGSVESLIKTMPGVSSSNELSSQYSVRGGNYDENLVYVNDIEIYRPFLIRSGQQEGLSFLNSDLVSSILFSAGGFDARYGDKMASVLDIQYKKPREMAGSVSASFLGAALHIEGISKNNKLTYLTGARYKSNQYILRAMETKGEYKPSFTDVQAYVSWEPEPVFEVAFLGNYANNNYRVVPKDRETSFGTINEAYRFKVYFEGQEVDRFENYMGALSFAYKPNQHINLKLIGSAFRSLESETYDLLGQYWIGRLESDIGSGDYGQVVEAIGVGTYLNHARNYLDAKVYSLEHRGTFNRKYSTWQWGTKFQHESIYDRIKEWVLIDSAGFSIPRPTDIPGAGNGNPAFEINSVIRATNTLNSNRYSAFLQNIVTLDGENNRLQLSAGLRINHWNLNDQTLVSPRTTLSYKPNWEKDIMLRFSAGYYFQPPFYRELRDFQGTVHPNIKAQSSIHFVAGSDWNFLAWNRPFKFVSELYYKYLDNLIPYEIDNVRIRYYATNNARGYATGIDLKVNGEFVSGIDSWASLSVMKTMEDIKDDFYYRYFDEKGNIVFTGTNAKIVDSLRIEPGYIPRPTDQRVNFSLVFQDYLPRNPTYKMHLSLLFGSGLTFGAPGSPKYKHTFRIPPYRRVDIGFSKQIIGEETRLRQGHPLKYFRSLWASFEVFNLLQVSNTVSYIWVSDVNNRKYGIPNYLTSRQINLKIQATF